MHCLKVVLDTEIPKLAMTMKMSQVTMEIQKSLLTFQTRAGIMMTVTKTTKTTKTKTKISKTTSMTDITKAKTMKGYFPLDNKHIGTILS